MTMSLVVQEQYLRSYDWKATPINEIVSIIYTLSFEVHRTPSKAGARGVGGGARGWHFHTKEPLLGDGRDALSSVRWVHCLIHEISDVSSGFDQIFRQASERLDNQWNECHSN